MAKTRNSKQTRNRRKKLLNKAEGYFGAKHRVFRVAKEQVLKSEKYSYRDRRNRKRDFRHLWILRINAATRREGIKYSEFMNGLKASNIILNRKILSEMAIHQKNDFKELVTIAKQACKKQT